MIEPSGLASGRVTGRLLLTFLELSESLLLHQVGTVGQGLLPSHLSHGEAWGNFGTVMLFILRIVQGLCTGGEISTVSTYIIEVGSRQTLARSMSLISVSIYVGLFLAQGVVWLVQDQLTPEAMRLWGWRLPFLISIVPGALTIAGRRCLDESAEFERERKVAVEEGHASAGYAVRDVLRRGYTIMIAIGGMVSFAVFSYSGLVWTNTFLAKEGHPRDQRMMAGLAARLIQMVLAVPVGWLADIWGVGSVTFLSGAVQFVAAFPLFAWLQANSTSSTVMYAAYAAGFGTIGALGGSTFNMYVAELFPTRTRNLGVGVSYNIGISVVGGFGPVLCSTLLTWSRYGPGGLMSLAGIITCVTIPLGVRLHQAGLIRMAHVRVNPYWALCEDLREDEKTEEQSSLESSGLAQFGYNIAPGIGRRPSRYLAAAAAVLAVRRGLEMTARGLRVLGATPWLEVVAPAGRALAQLQVELPRNGRADGYTPEHVQLFVAQEGEPLGEAPIFESEQFWSLAFQGEMVAVPPKPLPNRICRARLCMKRAAAQGGPNVRIQSIRVLTRRLKRSRDDGVFLGRRLWHDSDFTDCVLRSEDGLEQKVHKAILANASPVLSRMLRSATKEGEITLPCSGEVVRALLKHCYGLFPDIRALKVEDVVSLVEQAHALELTSLSEDAAVAATQCLTPETVVPLMRGLRAFYKAGSLVEEWDNLVRQVRARQDLSHAALLGL
ncbi:shiA [Symbiodinium natans]|uniref:ShiA protein n=1 Tax=Symbiodinium natans TaxID=878477 RepID=A0A812NZB2_9DINO|nr:shiA [Symbiodinium natans]